MQVYEGRVLMSEGDGRNLETERDSRACVCHSTASKVCDVAQQRCASPNLKRTSSVGSWLGGNPVLLSNLTFRQWGRAVVVGAEDEVCTRNPQGLASGRGVAGQPRKGWAPSVTVRRRGRLQLQRTSTTWLLGTAMIWVPVKYPMSPPIDRRHIGCQHTYR